MGNRRKVRLRYKVAMLVLVISILCVGAVGIFAFISAKSYMYKMADVEYMGRVRLLVKDIEAFLRHVNQDLMFLSKTPPIQGIIRARDRNGIDPIEKSTYGHWVERLSIIFNEFAIAKGHLMQIRFLDESGLELVRVDYDGRDARIVPEKELQDKSSRYYFREGIKLNAGEIYISGLDLNKERGKIEVPHKPTLRYATPIFDAKGDRRGLLVFNVLAERFLHLHPMHEIKAAQNIFITDKEGFYLRNCKDSSKEWGGRHDLNTGENLIKDYPEAAPLILSGQGGEVYSKGMEIFFLKLKISDRLALITGIEIPRSIVEAPLIQFKRFLVYVILGILCMTWIFSILFSRGLLNSIYALGAATERISRGDFKTPLEIESGDEIEELAGHFNNMLKALRKKTERLNKIYELGISTAKTSIAIADEIVSIIASALDIKMATVEKIKDDALLFVSFYDDGHILHQGTFQLKGSPCAEVKKEKKVCRYHRAAQKFPQDTFLQEHKVDTYLGVPVLSGQGEVMGIINAMDSRQVEFSEEDTELLYTLSRRMAFEWEQEAHINQIKYTNLRLETLYKLASSLAGALSLEKLLNNALDVIMGAGFLNLRKEAVIFLLDKKGQEIVLTAQRGLSHEMVEYDQRVKMGECICGEAAQTGKILFSSNSEKDPRHTRHLPHLEAHADIAVPFKSRDRITGVLHLYKEAGTAFSEDERHIFETMGNQIGAAIENVTLFNEVQNYNMELERKVAERTIKLEEAVDNAEMANRAKSDFLAGMSHELRTPLNAIIGFSEVLHDRYFGELNEKQAEYVNDIWGSGKHLLSLINDILDLSKVEAGKAEIELSPVKIRELLENSLVMIKEKSYKHGIRLDLQIAEEVKDLEIHADERKLKQILFNLLSNAAKFTPDGGEIRVTAGLMPGDEGRETRDEGRKTKDDGRRTRDVASIVLGSEASGHPSSIIESGSEATGRTSSIVISVADTGIGISPENQEKIFEDFIQVSGGLTGKTPGTGLGLPLAKRLVELHGGHIRVESEGEGKGSRFTFVLPLEPVIPAEEQITPFQTGIATDETFMNHLTRILSISERYNKICSLCRFTAPGEGLSKSVDEIRKALKQEKRTHDFLGMDPERNLYLILQETDREEAKIVCDRFKTSFVTAFELKDIDYAIVTFPQDGKTGEALIKRAEQRGA